MIFSINFLLCSILISFTSSSIYGLILLLLAAINLSFLLLSLGIETISILLLLVYVGALLILFAFVCFITLTTVKEKMQPVKFSKFFDKHLLLLFILAAFTFCLFYFFYFELFIIQNKEDKLLISYLFCSKVIFMDSFELLGLTLFDTFYKYLLLLEGILFFLIIVGVIAITSDMNKKL